MIRDEKYRPPVLETYCPVCTLTIDHDEWKDYGMHLYCANQNVTENNDVVFESDSGSRMDQLFNS